MKILWVLCVLCASVVNGFSLDREAFSITNYDLNLQIDSMQHRLGARGKITLRNDTASPEKIAVLQISSSLDWRQIRAADKPLQFVAQPFTSDIDHTGSLSEAIITLPREIAPHATIDLDIAYEGVIILDATRLTRIGTPEDFAKNSDWDRIDGDFTGVRGVGYVAWYPIATEVANLSEADSLFGVVSRWRSREAGATMHARFDAPVLTPVSCTSYSVGGGAVHYEGSDCTFTALSNLVPTFAVASYGVVSRPSITVYNLASHATPAEAYADAAEKAAPLVADWFGPLREKAKVADLPDPNAAPFETGAFLLTPLSSSNPSVAALAAAHQLTHASFSSPRSWINEGLAHFAQALYLEQQKGRPAALDYMQAHRSAFADPQPPATPPSSDDEVNNSLVSTVNEALYRSKAMCVWWMLRDMLGDAVLKKAIAAYKPEQDKEPSYMPRLISAQTQRDLEWFFDDWVYRDRGLPDFKVESAYARKTMTNSYMLTVTLENLGTAGAEVPVIIHTAAGELSRRVEVRAKSKATFRIETPGIPQEIQVNDGSVPESGTANNTFEVEPS